MDEIKKFIECLLPVTACNLRCSYCYIIQEGRRKSELPKLKYSPEHIGKALNKKRLGGTCYFSICGAGETLIPIESIQIVKAILDQGHFVNVTTNGTLTHRFEEIITWPKETLERLQFAFSFHYLELLRFNKLEEFFNNINKVRQAGCSFIVQINLCDEYVPYLEEIKKLCMEHVGALPHVAATRDEMASEIKLMTKYTKEEYYNLAKSFNSKLFDFTMKNFMVKRKEFCYAGEWAFALDLGSGILKQCYFQNELQNIFEDIDKPIKTRAVGKKCRNAFCTNSSHFMSLGVIPSIKTPSYYDLRKRDGADWYNLRMAKFVNGRLYDNNKQYSTIKKYIIILSDEVVYGLKQIKHKLSVLRGKNE